jgi:hypothetical protein
MRSPGSPPDFNNGRDILTFDLTVPPAGTGLAE